MPVHKIALVGAGRMGALHAAQCRCQREVRSRRDCRPRQGQGAAAWVGDRRDGAQLRRDIGRSGCHRRHCRKFDQFASRERHLPPSAPARRCSARSRFRWMQIHWRRHCPIWRRPVPGYLWRLIAVSIRTFANSSGASPAGDVGSAETLHIINHDPATPDLGFIPRSGGLFKDFTIHDFDTAAWLLDDSFVELSQPAPA